MKAADINYPDILVMEGAYQVKPALPFSPGKAGAGIVEKVGPGVTASTRPTSRCGAYARSTRGDSLDFIGLPIMSRALAHEWG